jgi:hypothetical protein
VRRTPRNSWGSGPGKGHARRFKKTSSRKIHEKNLGKGGLGVGGGRWEQGRVFASPSIPTTHTKKRRRVPARSRRLFSLPFLARPWGALLGEENRPAHRQSAAGQRMGVRSEAKKEREGRGAGGGVRLCFFFFWSRVAGEGRRDKNSAPATSAGKGIGVLAGAAHGCARAKHGARRPPSAVSGVLGSVEAGRAAQRAPARSGRKRHGLKKETKKGGEGLDEKRVHRPATGVGRKIGKKNENHFFLFWSGRSGERDGRARGRRKRTRAAVFPQHPTKPTRPCILFLSQRHKESGRPKA